jgi:glyoxylase-like metal-dependent hydrolase (beta-lactamase superfamily II)
MKSHLFTLFISCCVCFFYSQAEDTQESRIHKISDNVYNIINLDYSNIGVVIGTNSVALIESGMGDYEDHSNENVLKLIETITAKPIKYVINLHSHPDHSGGNNFFSERGATLVIHKNAVYSEFYDGRYPVNDVIRFDDKMTLDMGNEIIEIQHMIAHTFDDGIVYLKNSNLIFVGESYKPDYITYMGKLGKTSFDEWGHKALSKMDDKTIVVPSHGNASLNKVQLIAYRQNVLNWYERISTLYHQGKSIDDIVKDKVALSQIKKNDLDGNADHHGKYYRDDIQELIQSSVRKTPLLGNDLIQQYIGKYTQKGKVPIEVELIRGQLVAKQLHGFISWLKPISQNEFESISFFKEVFLFNKQPDSN